MAIVRVRLRLQNSQTVRKYAKKRHFSARRACFARTGWRGASSLAALFAPVLIAAKPVKRCGRGIFRALNLRLFLQQGSRWLRVRARPIFAAFNS